MIEHDPDKAGVDRLMEIFRQLPSFYKGHFEPKVLRIGESGAE